MNKQSNSQTMVNLTIPLYPYFPIGNSFPWDSPLTTEDIINHDEHDARLNHISMGSETGTRIMGSGMVSQDGNKIKDASLVNLVNRSAVILKIPKGSGEPITKDDIMASIKGVSEIKRIDATIVSTGWGDDQRWKLIGERYALESPYFTSEGAQCLLSEMEKVGATLLLTDCAYLDPMGQRESHKEWFAVPDWLRPPWPSNQAKAFLRKYSLEEMQHDWSVTRELVSKTWVIVGLANCGKISKDRVQITCLPMFIENQGQAPCTVVAQVGEKETGL